MAAKVGFGCTGTLRAGVSETSRYTAPRSFHIAAALIAAAAPLIGILLVSGLR